MILPGVLLTLSRIWDLAAGDPLSYPLQNLDWKKVPSPEQSDDILCKGQLMPFEKPKKKSGRPEFVSARIAELQRQLASETNENRKSELQAEINEWQRIGPKSKNERRR